MSESACILVMNAGSSSLKFSLYQPDAVHPGPAPRQPTPCEILRGAIDISPTRASVTIRQVDGQVVLQDAYALPELPNFEQLLARLMAWLEEHLPGPLMAAAHRIVHGGPNYSQPVFVTPQVRQDLQDAVPLMPLHLPHNLAPIDLLAASHPHLPQIACFDTGFHATVPRIERLFGLPRDLAREGVLRYGFHGLSYEYIASQLSGVDSKLAGGRVVVAHLGNGASVCALSQGRSVGTSMGFSALDGLVMGTRCGSLDPGVILYLLRERDMDVAQLEALLYQQSGLLGLSGGISSDMRELLSSQDAAAQEAIEVFVSRAAREIAALTSVLGGMDALIFTAGIGEHAPAVRAGIAARLTWMGLQLDEQANARHGPALHAPGSGIQAWVVPTDEDMMIARHGLALLQRQALP